MAPIARARASYLFVILNRQAGIHGFPSTENSPLDSGVSANLFKPWLSHKKMFHPLFQSRGENIWGRSNFQLSSLRGWEFPQARCAMSRLKNKAGCWVVLALPTSILAMPAQATSVRKANYWSLALACDRMDCSRQIMMQMGFTELGFLSATSLGFGEMLTVELGGA